MKKKIGYWEYKGPGWYGAGRNKKQSGGEAWTATVDTPMGQVKMWIETMPNGCWHAGFQRDNIDVSIEEYIKSRERAMEYVERAVGIYRLNEI